MAFMQNINLNFHPNPNYSFDLNEVPDGVGSYIPQTHLDAQAIDDNIENRHTENVDTSQQETQRGKRVVLSDEKRRMVYEALLERSVNGILKQDTTKQVSLLLSVPIRTVQRIWSRAKETSGEAVVDVSSRRAGKVGRKRVTIDLDLMRDVPLNRRTTLRSLAQALNANHVTLHRRLREGLIRRHSNAIKPILKEEHKIVRLKFCIDMLESSSLPQEPKFKSMYNIIHIDEKWFYLTKKSTVYYLLPNEPDPSRSCQSKNFIGKVMFLAAIARPRFDEEGNEVFSGKIGLFPFVTMEPAKRSSKRRDAGTLETKAITSVRKETIRSLLINQVLLAIRAKWPEDELGETIFIQQDNARTHVRPDDEEFRAAASQNGFDIQLICQPSNSPDMNVLDLGFFNAIQSLQDKECARTIDDLVGAVQRAFEAYPPEKINRVFLTLQLCMRETMKVEGSNNYKIPHINKARLESRGNLPIQIGCDHALVENVKNMLQTRQI